MTGHTLTVYILSRPTPVVCLGKLQFLRQSRRSLCSDRSVFNDFGPKFTCVDATGEQALSGMIVSVDKVRILPTSIF